jgi:hypothetical protein
MEQAAEVEQVLLARAIGQARIWLAEATEPVEQMITVQFRELVHQRKIPLETGKEAPGGNSIAMYGAGSQGSRECLNLRVKNLTEYGVGQWGTLVVSAAGEAGLSREWWPRRKILG